MFQSIYEAINWLPTILDLFIVYFLIYKCLIWINKTHAESLTKGLLVIFFLYMISHVLGLTTLNWLLGKFATVLVILIIIIFQPELRRFLERIGSGNMFNTLILPGNTQSTAIIQQLLKSIDTLSKNKIGALIVIEISSNLKDYIETGIQIKGAITAELINSLFWPGSPTHDGAVIIQENKIAAAGCLLPLTDTNLKDRRLGTRHRSALGLSEVTDAIVIIISEETGVITLAENGSLTRFLTKEAIETRLFNLYKEAKSSDKKSVDRFWKKSPFLRRFFP